MASKAGTPTHVEHGFGPVWDAGSRVLVLGSMPSPKSREMRFYYGHPRNRFWPVMAAIFGDGSCLCEECDDPAQVVSERTDFALRHHVALWDVIASCDIVGASDASITDVLRGYLDHNGSVRDTAADLPMTRLPSTSPANAGIGLPALIEVYGCVARAAES